MTGPVLVTGAGGFVGAHVARTLLHRGRDVVGLDLAPAPPAFVTTGEPAGRLTYVRGDVAEPAQLVGALVEHGAADVVHVAALLAEPESLQRPRQFLRVNAEAVWQLCDVARHLPAIRRVVTVSTRSVYGRYEPHEGPIDETFAPRPVAFYGGSKAAADLVVGLYREHFALDVCAARITGVYGPHQNYGHPLSEMVDAAVAGRPFRQDRGGDYLYEFTYVKDVVGGLLSLLDAPALGHAVYNVAGAGQVRLADAAAAVRAAVPEATIEIGPGLPEGAAPRAALSVERLARETGFRARWSLEDGVREFVDWKRTGAYGAPVE